MTTSSLKISELSSRSTIADTDIFLVSDTVGKVSYKADYLTLHDQIVDSIAISQRILEAFGPGAGFNPDGSVSLGAFSSGGVSIAPGATFKEKIQILIDEITLNELAINNITSDYSTRTYLDGLDVDHFIDDTPQTGDVLKYGPTGAYWGADSVATVDAVNLSFNGDIVPDANITYTIGDSTHRVQQFFVGDTGISFTSGDLDVHAGDLRFDGDVLATKNYVDALPQTLSGLTDVDMTGLVTGQVLKYNGTKWVPSPDIDTDTDTVYDDSTLAALVASLEATLNKLVPDAPSTLDGLSFNLTGTSGTYRLCASFTPQDNGAGVPVAGDSLVQGRNGYVGTSTINDVGPGDSGTVTLRLNGNPDSQTTLTSGDDAGTYGNLVISDNKDASLSTRDSGIVPQFYQVYDLKGTTVSVNSGYNGIYFEHGAAQTTSKFWYEDPSVVNPSLTVGTPTLASTPTLAYSSSVPHYPNNTQFKYTMDISEATGDMYNSNNNLVTTSGSTTGFNNSGNFQYDDFSNGSHPPVRNFAKASPESKVNGVYVTTKDVHATVNGNNAFRSHTLVTPYGNDSATPTLNKMINIMGSTARTNVIDEDNILVNMGTGSGNAIRVKTTNGDYANGTSFAFTATNALNTWDAAVVGGVLSNNTTNYQNYLPPGPDLSTHSANQYFTVKITRSQVSQFTINYTGQCAGCWVRMENNANWMASLNGYNGWGDMFKAYKGFRCS